MAGNRTRMVVYGTLKQDHGNHDWYLDRPEVEYLGRCWVNGPFRLLVGGLPMVFKDDGTEGRVLGEVYSVPEEVMLSIDVLEGHPEWYKREKVETPFGKAWMYVMQGAAPHGEPNAEVYDPSEDEIEWVSANG